MSETIYSADFAKYLPQSLTHDPKMVALAKAAEAELKVSGLTDSVLIYSRIEELSEDLLDLLAYDLHCDWYDYRYPVEVKRNILKNNIKIHRKLGTKYAVEKALADVYSTAKVKEWFEYNGSPFCFKVTVNVSQTGIDEKTTKEIEAKMKFYKNVRSHCDGVFYRMDAPRATTLAAARLLLGGGVKVKPLLKESVSAERASVQLQNELKLGGILKVKPKLQTTIKVEKAEARTLAGVYETQKLKVKTKLEDALKGGIAVGTALMYQKNKKNTMRVRKKEE